MALVHPAVVVGDVDDPDGDVLQILAPIPEDTALKWAVQFNRSVILKPVYLAKRKDKQTCMNYICQCEHIIS